MLNPVSLNDESHRLIQVLSIVSQEVQDSEQAAYYIEMPATELIRSTGRSIVLDVGAKLYYQDMTNAQGRSMITKNR